MRPVGQVGKRDCRRFPLFGRIQSSRRSRRQMRDWHPIPTFAALHSGRRRRVSCQRERVIAAPFVPKPGPKRSLRPTTGETTSGLPGVKASFFWRMEIRSTCSLFLPDDGRSGFPDRGIAHRYWRGIILPVKRMLFRLACPAAKSFLSHAGIREQSSHRGMSIGRLRSRSAVGAAAARAHSARAFAGPKHDEKPIFRFIGFATDMFLRANERLEATSPVKRASLSPPRFKISFC